MHNYSCTTVWLKYSPCLFVVDGGWTEWSQWSICRADCEDKGWQSRTRFCENPKPSIGGDVCDGLASTNRSCVGPCQGSKQHVASVDYT